MSDEIEDIENTNFQIPLEMIEEIYNNSGDGNIKGIFMITLDEKGETKIVEKFSHLCIEKAFLFDLSKYCETKEKLYSIGENPDAEFGEE